MLLERRSRSFPDRLPVMDFHFFGQLSPIELIGDATAPFLEPGVESFVIDQFSERFDQIFQLRTNYQTPVPFDK